jgi:hypothetical protein
MATDIIFRLPESYAEYIGYEIMSNFDRIINETTSSEIKGNNLFSRYAGWNFNGKVWWEHGQWNCEVWQYHCFMETVSAPTLSEIMHNVSETYGYD